MLSIDLGGEWTVAQVGSGGRVAAVVPGCVHTDLLAAGKISDPFYRDDELDVQWVGQADWVYARSFSVSGEVLGRERVVLRCEGLDTFATITINGRRVGKTDNQHRTWEFDVKRLLKRGRNRIEVRFDSPLPYIARREKQRPLPAWRDQNMVAGWGYVRKSACNFGWDWGIRTLTCGIWRDIYLTAFDTARLADLHIEQDHGPRGKVSLDVDATAELTGKAKLTAAVTVSFGDKVVASGQTALRNGKGKVALDIANPKLWWPAGMGDQPLYTVTVDLLGPDGELLDSDSRRIGVRTLRLIQKKDRWGTSFRFEANGRTFFAKGANWVPADAFVTRLDAGDYAALLGSAVAANMNMIRVWGGGIYEEDVFYDLCDELGVCVWQDFMFACSSYPSFDAEWLDNVRAEAADNVRRLRHHASLALWCGNNEIEGGLVADEWTDAGMSWADYKTLFDDVLAKVARRLDGGRDYVPGSPHTPGRNR
ncbi:MAG: glycoside hydrolase family 2 protein, partial [Planctomycetota bacterium]